MENRFQRVQRQVPKQEKERGCRIRKKRDKEGRVVDTEITGCSPVEIKAIMKDNGSNEEE